MSLQLHPFGSIAASAWAGRGTEAVVHLTEYTGSSLGDSMPMPFLRLFAFLLFLSLDPSYEVIYDTCTLVIVA